MSQLTYYLRLQLLPSYLPNDLDYSDDDGCVWSFDVYVDDADNGVSSLMLMDSVLYFLLLKMYTFRQRYTELTAKHCYSKELAQKSATLLNTKLYLRILTVC